MNLREALKNITDMGKKNHYFVRQKWLDSGCNIRFLPSFGTIINLTDESFAADDWLVIEGNLNDD